jgi:CHAT domain-containing protein
MRLPPDTPARRSDAELGELLRQARADLKQVTEDIRAEHPDFMPSGPDLPDILTPIPPGGALVAPLVTSQGSMVFVIPRGAEMVEGEHVIWLDSGDLLELLQGPADDPEWGGWLGAYLAFRDSGTEAASRAWQAAIETFTGQLWEALMGPVHGKLAALGLAVGAPVTLMPQGGLGLLPLHAAWRQVNGMERAFLDDYTVSYAPSAYALGVSHRRVQDERRHKPSLLAVINPTSDLRYTPIEGEAVAALFAPPARQTLVESAATQEAIVREITGRTYLHFACHGFYDWGDVMRSGLLLADRDPLALYEIISSLDLSAARLVTLSACETGLTEFKQSPDEYIGLPAGFLQAGAPGVLSTLWAVDDLSTALLMGEFYRHLLVEKQGIPDALRAAQLWLRGATAAKMNLADCFERLYQTSGRRDRNAFRRMRYFRANPDVRPFEHPYYWAGFVFCGV